MNEINEVDLERGHLRLETRQEEDGIWTSRPQAGLQARRDTRISPRIDARICQGTLKQRILVVKSTKINDQMIFNIRIIYSFIYFNINSQCSIV